MFKLGGNDAALLIMFFDADSVLYRNRSLLGQDGCTRVALFLGTIPIAVGVVIKMELVDQIVGNFCLL